MKKLAVLLLTLAILIGCSPSKSIVADKKAVAANAKDTIRIANDSLQYEIIIIEPGFDSWLVMAKPRNFYSLTYLENKNRFFVSEWNRRVLEPFRYNPDLYGMRIDYESNVRYGLEVNYLLYNYFIYFQNRYRQRL